MKFIFQKKVEHYEIFFRMLDELNSLEENAEIMSISFINGISKAEKGIVDLKEMQQAFSSKFNEAHLKLQTQTNMIKFYAGEKVKKYF